jgi:hypothetical protein
MTAQFNDMFKYRDKEFAVAGISTGEPFKPADFGLYPIQASTACWRGYVAVYAISDSHLVLDGLSVNLRETHAPTINGIMAAESPDHFKLFSHVYNDLKYRIYYTGSLMLGDEFIRELYVHMGFHPAWKYKTVFELTFENGRLTGEFDRSEQVAQKRHELLMESTREDKPDKMPTSKEINDFVERSFDRSYKKGEKDQTD